MIPICILISDLLEIAFFTLILVYHTHPTPSPIQTLPLLNLTPSNPHHLLLPPLLLQLLPNLHPIPLPPLIRLFNLAHLCDFLLRRLELFGARGFDEGSEDFRLVFVADVDCAGG